MDIRTRFIKTLAFEPVDRLPVIEWAPWWDKTIDRWHTEGLPGPLTEAFPIREYFGLDSLQQLWVVSQTPELPPPPEHGKGIIADMDGYCTIRKHLFPEHPLDPRLLAQWGQRQKQGDWGIWFTLDGFFWFPRVLFGIEEHLYAFHDQPELMHTINEDLLNFQLRVVDEICKFCRPEFMTFAEDMSYNKGVMISKRLFDEFLAPYYRRVIPRLKEYGVVPFVDSDGDIEELIPWAMGVGLEGFLPLEHQAGVDIVDLRRKFPKLKMIGAYDKMIMTKGEAAMRAEFERILPVMKQGGYIPSVDHQTPPGVSLAEYRVYLKLLNEYCRYAIA